MANEYVHMFVSLAAIVVVVPFSRCLLYVLLYVFHALFKCGGVSMQFYSSGQKKRTRIIIFKNCLVLKRDLWNNISETTSQSILLLLLNMHKCL